MITVIKKLKIYCVIPSLSICCVIVSLMDPDLSGLAICPRKLNRSQQNRNGSLKACNQAIGVVHTHIFK